MVEHEFSGGVFCDAIEGRRAGAAIEVSPMSVVARTTDGQRYEIPYHQCEVEIGGFSGRMVFCHNRDHSLTIFCEDRRFPAALSSASTGLLDQQLDQQQAQRRGRRRRERTLGAAIVVGLLALIVGGYWAIRESARMAIQAVPIRVDQEIGQRAFENIDLGGPIIDDPVVNAAISSMVDRLAPHAAIEGLEFEVHVVDSPEVNAFALPAGTIVVYSGLIKKADTVEQVAGVLGHEMAHATLRHGLERISQAVGLAVAVNLLLGDTQGLIAAGAELFQLASINSYSREQEAAADAEAVRMLHAAGIDPRALTKFFETLHQQHGELPGVVSWMSTHPQHQQRIDAVRSLVATLPKKEYQPLAVDWDDVQQRAGPE